MAPLAATLNGALSGAGWDAQGSISAEVREELRTSFPELGAEAAVVVYQQEAPIAGDPSGLTRPARVAGVGAERDRPRRSPDPARRGGLGFRRWADCARSGPAGGRDRRRLARSRRRTHRLRRRSAPPRRRAGRGDRCLAGLVRLQPDERGSAAPGRVALRSAERHPPLPRLRHRPRRRSPAAARDRRHRLRLRRPAPDRHGHAALGLGDELLDDDRSRRRHRLQPVHRLPLPRGTLERPRPRSTRWASPSRPPGSPCSSRPSASSSPSPPFSSSP